MDITIPVNTANRSDGYLLLIPYAVLPMIATRFAACAGRLIASFIEAWVSGTQ